MDGHCFIRARIPPGSPRSRHGSERRATTFSRMTCVPVWPHREGYVAGRGPRLLKLWGDSLAALGLEGAAQSRAINWLDKSALLLPVESHHDSTVKCQSRVAVTAVVTLCPHTDPSTPTARQRLSATEAVPALLAAMYHSHSMTGGRAASAMAHVCDLAQRVPVVKVCYGRAYDNLPAIRTALLRCISDEVVA